MKVQFLVIEMSEAEVITHVKQYDSGLYTDGESVLIGSLSTEPFDTKLEAMAYAEKLLSRDRYDVRFVEVKEVFIHEPKKGGKK